MYIFKIIAVIVGSYLFGNINTALIISKIKKGDVRKMGSGNPGTMNMFRNYGPVYSRVVVTRRRVHFCRQPLRSVSRRLQRHCRTRLSGLSQV